MKIGFVSLGCPKNLVDAEVMLGLAQQAGHELTPDAARRRRARRQHVRVHRLAPSRSRSTRSSRWREHKTRRRAASGSVVTGCLAERYRDELQKEIPEIDAVLGTGEVPRDRRRDRRRGVDGRGVADAADASDRRLRADSRRARRASAPEPPSPRTLPTYIYDADTPRLLTTPRHYAYVKIAEGCDYTCAFCIIPTLRGAVSQPARPTRSCARRARWRRAASRSCCSSRRTRRSTASTAASAARSARLLRELNAIDGLEWIRLLYLYPTTIDDDVLDGDGRVREGLQVHRPAAAARVGRRC